MSTGNPLWYKEAIVYQLHLKSFKDSNGDGIGDFKGLTEKLSYLRDLGVNTLWILPFYPSPLKDDGYDIADYYSINPIYGDISDFKRFLNKAKSLGLRVITELVMNHTSDQHPWFQRARRAAKGSKERDFYVWSNEPDKYLDARIIFKDFEPSNWSWDPIAESYYWHRFYHHQPDLNFENPAVHKAMLDIIDYWFNMGVDGLRLDAIPYLYEEEGTNCENLTKTHDFLKKIRTHIEKKHTDKMLLAEANQWAEDAVEYFGEGDECHMNFNFPLMPRLYMSVEKEDRFPIMDIINQTPEIPENCQWATFLRNHDELTLEMVTDNERDFMYRAFANETRAKINLGIRRRLAPLLGNSRKKIELLNTMLFAMEGTPIIYYGDEIGMGDNIYLGDRNGVRTPFQWSPDRNAGFSKAQSQQLYLPIIVDYEYHYEAINVENQEKNQSSLLWWMRRLINIRKKNPALSKGKLELLHPSNHRILAFLRICEEQTCLVILNLSRYVQHTKITLTDYTDHSLKELFGESNFLQITNKESTFTIGPHDSYLFEIVKPSLDTKNTNLKLIEITSRSITNQKFFTSEKVNTQLSKTIKNYIKGSSWFLGKKRIISETMVSFVFPFLGKEEYAIMNVKVLFKSGGEEEYIVPVKLRGQNLDLVVEEHQDAVIARVTDEKTGQEANLIDACYIPEFRSKLLAYLINSKNGHLTERLKFKKTSKRLDKEFKPLSKDHFSMESTMSRDKNSTFLFEDKIVIKFMHQLASGPHPEAEIGELLTMAPNITPTANFLGSLDILASKGSAEARTFIVLNEYIPNKRNLYEYTIDHLNRYFDEVMTIANTTPDNVKLNGEDDFIAREVERLTISFNSGVNLIGKRLRQLHYTLAFASHEDDLCYEKASELYLRSHYQSIRENISRGIDLLSEKNSQYSPEVIKKSEELMKRKDEILNILFKFFKKKINFIKIRDHGDLKLDQILFTGRDYFFVDFEGDHNLPLTARRIKRIPLLDLSALANSMRETVFDQLITKSLNMVQFNELYKWSDKWSETTIKTLKSAYFQKDSNESQILYGEEINTIETMFAISLMSDIFYHLPERVDSEDEMKVYMDICSIIKITDSLL